MRWRSAAAAAVGVVAAIGLSAHEAAAEPVDKAPEPQPQPTTTTTTPAADDDFVSDEERQRLAEAEAARIAAASRPQSDGPVRQKVTPVTFPEIVEPEPTAQAADVVGSVVAVTTKTVVAQIRELPLGSPRGVARPWSARPTAPTASAPLPTLPSTDAPADEPQPSAPVSQAPAALNLTPSAAPKATPPAAVAPPQPGHEWYPAWAADLADQRIAEKWGNAPVRGPPPSAATALGNDARNTTTQVSVVRGPSGSSVTITQNATVHNVGSATANGGPATATGNTSDTLITQVTVIKQRGGTGTAVVDQDADVDNVGVARATSAGTGAATAVGNDSTTNVTQVAVIYVHGSGDAHVTQNTAVQNVGVASATATNGDAAAVGNQSSTDVTQLAVVHVHDDDVKVGQTSTTQNFGVAASNSGTATGNMATNTTVQVATR